jgi:hypothetical protein
VGFMKMTKKNTNLVNFLVKKKKKKKLHILTRATMRGFGLTSLVVCTNNKTRDRRGRNMTIRSEICTKNIHFLGFHDIREGVTLWGLTLWSLGCIQ